MCVAEMEHSAGYNTGRWNKHKTTVFPQKIYYSNLRVKKRYNAIRLSGNNFIIIHNMRCLLVIKFSCRSWLIIVVNICPRL